MSESPDQLDPLLHRWASSHEPSAERLADLRQKILREAAPAPQTTPAARTPDVAGERSGRWKLAALAIAASLAVAVIVWRWQLFPAAPQTVVESPQVRLPQEHLSKLLAEMNNLFDQRLAWVAETNREVSIGLENDNERNSTNAHVAVRIVLLQRAGKSDHWETIWTGDIATRSEQRVQVVSERDGSQLQLWAYVLPDGTVSIDTQFALSAGAAPIWNSSAIQQSDVPTQVLAERRADSEFQVWQTAVVLPEASL